ncbi:MAG: hypothetical protein QM767_16250 [Anaeromyxobacter sp.]
MSLVAAAVLLGISVVRAHWPMAAAGAVLTAYFALRLFAGLGKRP